MKTNALTYSLKVWLTSVAIAPIAYLVAEFGFKEHFYSGAAACLNQMLYTYPVLILVGGIFSLLTWLLFFLTVAVILTFYLPDKQIKYVIAIFGVIFTVATFWLLFSEGLQPNSEFFPYMIANCVCIAGGALFYDLKKDVVQDTGR
ncbi:hypothetical protein FPZ43_18650 [Mucilaginibacter pallidiroseus]|uniref:Uncharacterized protein n=1 Tax=Mucilaginibacter pallidiroseus TaxID=2599295 RepID=A0A563U0P6_9SPHI|nr:hypothetical protein [Mucilaginibacter pallidiroseus]TWR24029.1 hypothetical protein FPZ43_18650 [Mucilaginibacter pallidiroseus]